MIRRLGVITLGVAALIALMPSVAQAHGIGGRLDLPVPLSYFLVGAGLVLVISFVALAVLWPTPRLQGGPLYEPARLTVRRSWVLPSLGVIGLLLVISTESTSSLFTWTDRSG